MAEMENSIHLIGRFFELFQREILDMLPFQNNSELSAIPFRALHEIHLDQDMTPSLLSTRLGMPMPNISRCLHQLESADYIQRIQDENDKRIVHLRLLPRGKELVDVSLSRADKQVQEKFSVLSPDELKKFTEAFEILIDGFQKVSQHQQLKK